ncbi:hypothetical protein FOXG_07038 [Fusarium oxysporum f. sp. lycopersici 4287]|uniref:Uncharacterized protein n=2 Tax=Fusarium oxysporum TaxID=5507 RepID=A0A0J9V453_FUSO4|nr:hypothetical protein FOXG_07038 [Fusarium oxysporum f. sp. lycopersici 4287]KAJ9419676.1 hypothetical protein QL093DRAFT_2064057 [Fusarium oxysporum]KNB06269.1 hypothetical protein FOXG_07038 [Fusarium oxysporum f. sp. lycopersici 4287]
MLTENPPLDGSYRDLLLQVDAQWDPEDDEAIDEEWDQSAQKANSMVFKPAQHGSLLTLFKVCLRLYQTTPITILSPYHRLCYQPVSSNGMGNKWVYSKLFCDDLTALMVHPVWEANTGLLVAALAWTVICRLDDRRLWGGSLNKSCPALDSVYEQVQRCSENGQALPSSYHDMHKSARERASQRGESTSEWSDLFLNVGELASQQTAAEPDDDFQSPFGFPVLPVTLSDLRLLTEAVDATNLRPECNYSVKDALMGWNAEVSGQNLPGMKQLPLVFEISWKNVFRHLKISGRGAQSHAVDASRSHSEGAVSEQNTLLQRDLIASPGLPPASEEEDEVEGGFDGSYENEFGGYLPATDGSEAFSHESAVPERVELPIHTSHRERELLSEISELRKEIRELREGQRRQDDLMLTMQSKLRQIKQSIQAPTPSQSNLPFTMPFGKPNTASESVLDEPDLWWQL